MITLGLYDNNTGDRWVARFVNETGPSGGTGLGLTGEATLLVSQAPVVDNPADFSANVTGVTGTVLATVPQNPNRQTLTIQPLGPTGVWVKRSQTASGPSGPTSVAGTSSAFYVLGGATGSPGGIYTTSTFKGQAVIEGPTGTMVAVFED